jgi:putative ABC transport system permease protein
MTIVGVVRDVRWNGPTDPSDHPQKYIPYLQHGTDLMSLLVRTHGDPMKIAGAVRSQMASVDKDQSYYSLMTLEQRLADTLSPASWHTLLATAFGVLAMGLATVGIYGVISFSVTERRHEMGVRMALGARRGDILRLVLGEGLLLTLAGLGFGLWAAFWLTQFLERYLFQVGVLDPSTFMIAPLGLGLVVALACSIPARRAASVDPMVTLRNE